jgi:hypothetical protein
LFSFKKFLLDYDGKRYECQPKKPGDDAAVGFIPVDGGVTAW